MLPGENQPVDKLIDAGYATWTYGAVARMAWKKVRHNYTMAGGALWLMDSRTSARKEFYPDYKSHRKDKRAKRPEIFEQVLAFKSMIDEDPSFRQIWVEGLEADDLVTAIGMEYDLPIVGRDKDLLQCPIILMDITGTEIELEHFRHTLPKTVRPHVHDRNQICLLLSLLGDKSDDIPRLIPPRRLDLLVNILNAKKPWATAYNLYKEDLVTNLYLAALPGPWTYQDIPTPKKLLEVYNEQGSYSGVLRYELTDQLENLKGVLNVTRRNRPSESAEPAQGRGEESYPETAPEVPSEEKQIASSYRGGFPHQLPLPLF